MFWDTRKGCKAFHKNVVSAIQGKTPDKTTTSQYGTKHTYNTELISKVVQKLRQMLLWLFKEIMEEQHIKLLRYIRERRINL